MNKSYAQVARELEPQTPREHKLKELCKLTCSKGVEHVCPCYSPLQCQLVLIYMSRQSVHDASDQYTEDQES